MEGSTETFLKLTAEGNPVPGSSKTELIVVSSWNWSVLQASEVQEKDETGGAANHNPNIGELVVHAKADKAFPLLAYHCCKGSPVVAELTADDRLTLKLEIAMLENVSIDGAGGDPTMTITIESRKFSLELDEVSKDYDLLNPEKPA